MTSQILSDINLDTSSIKPDLKIARLLSTAYATPGGEMNAICQYFYHHLQFLKQGYKDTANMLMKISEAEMRHLNILGKLISALGVDPILSAFPPIKNYFYSTGYVSYSNSPIRMLKDDIKAEKEAIATYEKIINNLEDGLIKDIIKEIKSNEEQHLLMFEDSLKKFETIYN